MTAQLSTDTAPEEFILRLLKGRRFAELYDEVMEVVERCAAYLDGEGRGARAALPLAEQAAFARLSMWLTASLMRSASVVLVLRAVARGEMAVEAAMREVEPTRKATFGAPPAAFQGIPDALAGLLDDGMRVKEASERFVSALNGDLPRPAESPALRQMRELRERLEGSGLDGTSRAFG